MTQGRGTPLRVAMIGHAFMGAAHSQAWRSAPRFFELPRDVVMAVVAEPSRPNGAAAERLGWAEPATDWRASSPERTSTSSTSARPATPTRR